MSDSKKRTLESDAPSSPKASPAKKQKPNYTFNMNKALDKAHEGKSLAEIVKLPPSALQGLADRADEMLKHFHVNTIADLANWKFYRISHAILVLSETEEPGKRSDAAESNINKALDKEYETKTLAEIVEAPVSALQGLAEWADSTLAPLHVKTIRDLGKWKYAAWAAAIVELSHFESPDHSS